MLKSATRITASAIPALVVVLVLSFSANATSIFVDDGVVDVNPGDGQCSLLEAFEAIRLGNAYQGTLNGVTLDDGGTASGTFIIDSQLGFGSSHLIDWNIAFAGGSVGTFPPRDYTPLNSTVFRFGSASPSGIGFELVDSTTGIRLFRFAGNASLITTGNVPLYLPDTQECLNCNPARLATSGSIDMVDLSPSPPAAGECAWGNGNNDIISLAGGSTYILDTIIHPSRNTQAIPG